MQYMGVNVSPSEANLLKFAQDCPDLKALPDHLRQYAAERLQAATLLQKDIYRVADWQTANG